MTTRALCIDPGFANFGWGLIDFPDEEGAPPKFVGCGVLHTEKDSALHKPDDFVERGQALGREFLLLFAKAKPDIVYTEAPSWVRDSTANAKLGFAWGLVSACIALNQTPIDIVAPQQLKFRLTGDRSATKETVRAAVVSLLPEAEKPLRALGRHYDHAADALGAGLVLHALRNRKATRRSRIEA